MYKSLLQPDLKIALRDNDAGALQAFCQALHPADFAEIVEEMDASEIWRVLGQCSVEKQAEIFPYFSLAEQEHLVEAIDRQSLSRIIEEMASDDRADLLGRMDQDHVDAVLPLIAQAERNDILRLMSYPEDSAGSLVTTEYASLPADITAAEAINRLRLQAPSRETIYYIYIVDEQRRLLGLLSLRRLIQAKPQTKLADLMEREVIKARLTDDREDVANEILRLTFLAMPVVDDADRLVGIITYDDAASVIQEEATEDAHRLAAVSPLEDSYLDTPLLTLGWKRGMWLVILLGAAFLTATVLQYFQPQVEAEIESAVHAAAWMVMFIPMVLASGGNAGSQSATLIIRMLAVEEARGNQERLFRLVLLREIKLGCLLGVTVGSLAYLVARALVASEKAQVVGMTVFLVVCLGAVTGAMLPLILNRLKLDPALMSNPLIASLVDVMGVVIYYQMAAYMLGG
ncbi:MAG: magnesium transporter [Planctomycetaceae bacterium]|nr:magnesium transporter [Planctomycetaceae bacterium]